MHLLVAAVASDYCEPCPENGVCYDGKLECDQGYKKHGKLCVEDEDVDEIAKKLVRDIFLLISFFIFLYRLTFILLNLGVCNFRVVTTYVLQSKWVEVRLCEAYAQLLCCGTGKCWVCDTCILSL